MMKHSVSHLALLILVGLSACSEARTPAEPTNTATIAAVSAAKLGGVVNQAAEPAPRVRVVDSQGHPLRFARIQFAVASGGGKIIQADTLTDANGEAGAQWVLGTTLGDNQLLVTTTSPRAELRIDAYPRAGPATRLVPWEYGHIDAVAFAAESLAGAGVRVTDAFGNAVSNADVSFRVSAGGGHLKGGSDSVHTGVSAFGQVSVAELPTDWILGAPGLNRLTATVRSDVSVSFDVVALDTAVVTWFIDASPSQQQKLALSADGYFIQESSTASSVGRYVGTYSINGGTITLNGCSTSFFDPGDLMCSVTSGQVNGNSIVIGGRTYSKRP